MVLKESRRFASRAHPNGRKWWGCPNWPGCDVTVGCHPDGRPLGVPAGKATKAARIRAHASFDRLWKSGFMSRGDAYAWLRTARPDLPKHIAEMNAEQCAEVVKTVAEYGMQAPTTASASPRETR